MFDKTFAQDERVLLHRWDVLHERFMLLAQAGQMVLRGTWESGCLRDVLANAADELASVERELVRFRPSPADSLAARDGALWHAAATWVAALREWTVPPESWTAGQLSTELERRQLLEARLMETIAAFAFGDNEPESDVAAPIFTRGA